MVIKKSSTMSFENLYPQNKFLAMLLLAQKIIVY